MNIVCLDLEGVLVPEIWIAFSSQSGIPELRRTTRDEPDYEKLMRWRLAILKEHGLKLSDVQNVIAKIDPLPGAKEFLDSLREKTQAVILSDTFEEFAMPLMKKLGLPTILCNSLVISEDGFISDFKLRCKDTKLTTVRALQSIGFDTIAKKSNRTIRSFRHMRRMTSCCAQSALRFNLSQFPFVSAKILMKMKGESYYERIFTR